MNQQSNKWRVEPGDAVGLAIRIPVEHINLAIALLSPVVKRSTIAPADNFPTFYVTRGKGTHNGRRVPHKFVTVICNPPPWISADPALGILTVISAPRDPGAQFFWQAGYGQVIGQISLKVTDDHQTARARIATDGGVLRVNATLPADGETWTT